MPTPTYTPLAEITLGSSAASVTFSSMTSGFRDYIVVYNGTQSASAAVLVTLNSDTTNSNYNMVYMRGTGSGSGDSGVLSNDRSFMYFNGSEQCVFNASFLDATATDKHKTVLIRDGAAAVQTVARAGRWSNTSAITSIQFSTGSGTFNTGSSFALYGIAA